MSRPRQVIKDGMKWCDFHAVAEPVEAFDLERVNRTTGTPTYSPRCKLAKQTISDEKIALDPALHAIRTRAAGEARVIGQSLGVTISAEWVMTELHYRGLVPIMRALISPGGSCLNCAKHWDEPKYYTLDHRVPPLNLTDWPARHARNIQLVCPGCNGSKGRRDADRAWIAREHQKWMQARHWADHADEKGWPPLDPYFGEPTELVVVDTAHCDALGTGTLFDVDPFTVLGPPTKLRSIQGELWSA